jgi:predicted nucleic acid-binding protein
VALVVDASVALQWVVHEAGSDAAATLVTEELHAPVFLLAETTNVLWAKVRRGELTAGAAAERAAVLLGAPLTWHELPPLVEPGLALALRLGHPVYDCLYLALAIELNAALVTADQRLLRAVAAFPDLAAFVRPLQPEI